MSSDDTKIWFSAAELARLAGAGVIKIARSSRRSGEAALKLGWPDRKVLGKGGKGGLKTEYMVPQELRIIVHSFLNQNPNFFLEAKGGVKDKTYPASQATELTTGAGQDNGHRLQDRPRAVTSGADDFVFVPQYDVRASAGHGSLVHSEQIVDHLAFKKAWVKNSLGCNAKDLALITVKGDSMEPTLSNDDLILVNLQRNQITNNAVYVLQYDGALLVKRIQRLMNGSVVIKGDNPEYRAEELSANQAALLRVFGMVVWYGRKL